MRKSLFLFHRPFDAAVRSLRLTLEESLDFLHRLLGALRIQGSDVYEIARSAHVMHFSPECRNFRQKLFHLIYAVRSERRELQNAAYRKLLWLDFLFRRFLQRRKQGFRKDRKSTRL